MRAAPPLPGWAEVFVLPVLNLLAAFAACALIILALGESPFQVIQVMITGAFVWEGSLGYTLYYATNFIFTGLAVAVAFQAKLFNIGGEGQAMLGGIGASIMAIYLAPFLPWIVLMPLIILASACFGAAWGAVPGYLQAYRGSHIVITTIMFNFIAAALIVWLLSGLMKHPTKPSPETIAFLSNAQLPKMHEMTAWFGWKTDKSPLNASFLIALIACVGVWALIWRTRLGFAIRALGNSPQAAHYAGIKVARVTVIVLAISGALAGMMALNEVIGAHYKMTNNFTQGFGFTGIAVALIGRNHPVGIILASLLFGFLYQGGTEIDFEFSTITREMVLLIQGMIILFSGALYYMFDPWVARLLALILPSKQEA